MTITYGTLLQYARDQVGNVNDAEAERIITRATRAAIERDHGRNWHAWKDPQYRVNLVPPYDDGSVAVNHNGTAVTGTGTTFPTTAAGQPIRFRGESVTHMISTRDSATALTLVNAYGNEQAENITGADYEIVFPVVTLPARTTHVDSVWLTRDKRPLCRVGWDELFQHYSNGFGIGSPRDYAIKRSGDSLYLAVFPAPDLAYQLDICKFRKPALPTVEGDNIDWPSDMEDLLRATVKYCLSMEEAVSQNVRNAQTEYIEALNMAIARDQSASRRAKMGQSRHSPLMKPQIRYNFLE